MEARLTILEKKFAAGCGGGGGHNPVNITPEMQLMLQLLPIDSEAKLVQADTLLMNENYLKAFVSIQSFVLFCSLHLSN